MANYSVSEKAPTNTDKIISVCEMQIGEIGVDLDNLLGTGKYLIRTYLGLVSLDSPGNTWENSKLTANSSLYKFKVRLLRKDEQIILTGKGN